MQGKSFEYICAKVVINKDADSIKTFGQCRCRFIEVRFLPGHLLQWFTNSLIEHLGKHRALVILITEKQGFHYLFPLSKSGAVYSIYTQMVGNVDFYK